MSGDGIHLRHFRLYLGAVRASGADIWSVEKMSMDKESRKVLRDTMKPGTRLKIMEHGIRPTMRGELRTVVKYSPGEIELKKESGEESTLGTARVTEVLRGDNWIVLYQGDHMLMKYEILQETT